MKKRTIKDISLQGKSVLLRVDYNIPLENRNGEIVIADDTRIKQSLETIKYIMAQGVSRLVLGSHLGDPGGKRQEDLSMLIVAKYLEKTLGKKFYFFDNFVGKEQQDQIRALKNGELVLLENLRFWKGEELNQIDFARKLAILGDVFVNDAFGSCHRAHASVVGVASLLPTVAGLLLDKEIEMISRSIEKPQSPFVVVLGGAKAITKIPVIERLMTQADYMLLGGGVANTFLKAFGYNMGRSMYSKEMVRTAQGLIWKATRADTKLFLPTDLIMGSLVSHTCEGVVDIEEVPMQFQALDIGPKTSEEYGKIIGQARTIIWNGPMGACEVNDFAKGTKAIYDAIVANRQAISIVGGGDTLASLKDRKDQANISHISTGGGAMLEFIEKGNLPGIEIIPDK